MPDTLAGLDYQGHGLEADAGEAWHHPGGSFYLLPRLPHQERRTRGGDITSMGVHPSFKTRRKTRYVRPDARNGVEVALARSEGRHVFAGDHNYRDEDAA